MNNTNIFDKDLNPILEISTNEDLDPLVKYLEKKMSQGLTNHEVFKKNHPNHSIYADLIAKEIRDMGGNSFSNAIRNFEGPAYHEIVCDVAKKLKAPYNKNNSIENIENSIIETILVKCLENMSDEDKKDLAEQYQDIANKTINGQVNTALFLTLFRAGGFKSYQLTLIVANQIARIILGRGLSFATNAALTRVASILAGPVGWVLTGIWTAVDIAGPAYSVTIPSVIHIAMLRKKANLVTCKNCGHSIEVGTKFCSECGSAV